MKRTKRNILIEFVGQRLLTDAEADVIRAMVSAMRPKMHLILPNWHWLECRGLGEQKAAQLIEAIDMAAGDSRRLFRRADEGRIKVCSRDDKPLGVP